MFVDTKQVPPGTVVEADVCIVGAGAAGITIALELLDSPLKVVLLESGSFRSDKATHELNVGESVGLPYGPLETTRSRYFGGSTNCWGGFCKPLDPDDFERRSWVRHSGWPISWADLDSHYVRASELLRLRGMDYDAAGWVRQIANPRVQLLPFRPDRIVNEINQFSSPARFGPLYRKRIENAANIHVYLHSNVVGIETDADAATVTGLSVVLRGGKPVRVQAKLVVLAAGGIENPRLLLASDSVAPAGLGNGHDLVGRFFMEHPRLISDNLTLTSPTPSLDFYDARYSHNNRQFAVDGVAAAAYLSVPRPIREQEGLLKSRLLFQSIFAGEDESGAVALRRIVRFARREEPATGLGKHFWTVLRNTDRVAIAMAGRFSRAHRLISRRQLITTIEPEPNPDSRVTLVRDRDALGMRRVAVSWQLTGLVRQTFMRSQEILTGELERLGLGTINPDIWEPAGWPDDLYWCWHHMGTTRMSADPKEGVVDADCRVHGMHNLYVAGSSVFPTVGSDMPTLTIVALALRLAERIRAVAGEPSTTPESQVLSASA